jgi:DNA-binding IclR family transcriptional regulator
MTKQSPNSNLDASLDEAVNLSGSLAKGLKLIELLLESPMPQGVSQVASGAGLDGATAHRLLQVLVERGYAVRDRESKRYMAGPRGLSPLGVSHPLRELSRESAPILGSLRNSTGETCALVIFQSTQRLVCEMAPGAHPLVPYYDTWLRSPLHGSASGKVLLASLAVSERKALLGPGPYQSATPYTITDPAVLEVHLAEVNARGYALARDDAFVGMTAIAAPLKYANRVVGCLAIVGRSESMPSSSDTDHAEALANAAALLSHSAPSLRNVNHMFNCRGPTVV